MILRDRRRSEERRQRRAERARARTATVTKAEARIEAERRVCRASLYEFTKAAWPIIRPGTEYVDNWHIRVICDHLQALFFGLQTVDGHPLRRLVINMPPRHMKTIIADVMLPGWAWTHDPSHQFFFSTYAQHLSDDSALDFRQLIHSEWYITRFGPTGNRALDAVEPPVALGGRQQTRHTQTTAQGARQASSVAGKTTGVGGDTLVADDPHNVAGGDSERKVTTVIVWWTRGMSTRGNDPKTSRQLVIMQRLFEGDLADVCLAMGYDALILPARWEGVREIGCLGHADPRTEIGEPLWPARFGDAELRDLEQQLDDAAPGQLQQRPAPPGGGLFKVDFLRKLSAPVRDALLRQPGALDQLAIFCDFGQKGRSQRGRKRSYSVAAVWGKRGSDVFLFDIWREQCEFDRMEEGLRELAAKWPQARPIIIEDKAAGTHIGQRLARILPGVMMVNPRGDKDHRARAVSPFMSAGNVWVPTPDWAPWVLDWLREHELFPRAANDDQVDVTSMALDYLLLQNWATPYAPEQAQERSGAMPVEVSMAAARQRAALEARWRALDDEDEPEGLVTRRYTGAAWG